MSATNPPSPTTHRFGLGDQRGAVLLQGLDQVTLDRPNSVMRLLQQANHGSLERGIENGARVARRVTVRAASAAPPCNPRFSMTAISGAAGGVGKLQENLETARLGIDQIKQAVRLSDRRQRPEPKCRGAHGGAPDRRTPCPRPD